MKIKNNNRQRYNSIQGLRSFKDTLPTKVKKIIVKKGEIYSKTLENCDGFSWLREWQIP